MKFRSNAVLLATLASAAAWGQEVNVYGTTLAQLWKQEATGFDKSTFAPATQFLGVDAVGLGSDTLSLHLFGWGRVDLADQSRIEGKSGGELTFGYVKYRASKGNLEVQAGRFAVNQGVAIEQVDGGSVRADLIGGFTVSAFGGRPVLYKTVDLATQKEYDLQRDVIFGGRVAKRFSHYGEIGVSYVQDGTTPAKDLPTASTYDYTRRQAATDIRFSPISAIDLSGKTVWDVARHEDLPAGSDVNTNRIAEHDYNLGIRFAPMFSLNGTYTQRNFRAYYAGTNMPNLFNQYEPGRFRSEGLAFTIGSATSVEGILDVKKTDRESYGQATRFGGELRWRPKGTGLQTGLGYHRVTADDVQASGVLLTSYGLSYNEIRAWLTYEKGKFTAAADAIHHRFDDKQNPNLYGKTSVYEVVGSLGYQAATNFKISGDLSYGVTPILQKETRALFRAEYRFGMASKGGK
ncbi:MAG TPA: hypothetical protein VJ623_13790 [Holophagaceae bacterium]|nr:hypothetical protein [Holophagaceae bacterium]